MLRDLTTAVDDVLHGGVLRYVALALTLGVAVFAGVWLGVDALLATWVGEQGWLATAVSWLGAAATLVLAWLLFPAVASAIVSLFLDGVVAAVERRHWPHLPKAPGLPWPRALLESLRFLALLVAVNVVLLGLLLAPPVYAIAWPLANGWLLAREYFDVVALRRLEPRAARELRERHRAELLALGVLFALLFTLPLVNLLMPVWVTAVMAHRFHRWSRTAAR
jgi:CysZ protein